MNLRILTILPAVLAGLIPAGRAAAGPLVLHVSPAGDDAADGRTPATAVAGLAAARDLSRAARAAGEAPDGVVVEVAPGAYSLTETLTFTAADAGTAAAPLIFRGPRDAKPMLRGGRTITGFRPHRDAIQVADLSGTPLAGKRFEQLFFRGERMILARTPNRDPDDVHGGTWAHVVEPDSPGSRTGFVVSPREVDPGRWTRPADGRVSIFPNHDWAFNAVKVAEVAPAENRIRLAGRTSYDITVGDRYFVEGLFEELDAPGEWYLDGVADKLYFWPPSPLDEGDVVAPVVGNLIELNGADHVRFEQFILEDCEQHGVAIADSEGAAVAGCVIRNVGSWAVTVNGGRACAVRGCDIHATGRGGIQISGGDRATLTPSGHVADNNHIHDIATFWRTYQTGINLAGVGNAATHNLIHHTPHAGMTLAGNDNLVEYNVIHHVNLQSHDTGGIYSCPRDWTQRGNTIRYNIWHDIGGYGKANSWAPVSDGKVKFQYPHFTWGIYMDDPTSGNLIYGNLLYDLPVSALHNHGGRDNVWQNNIIVDAPAFQAGMLAPNWDNWPAIQDKFAAVCQPGSVYFERYPELKHHQLEHPEAMTGLKYINNIVYYTREGTQWLRDWRNWGNSLPLYTFRLRDEDFGQNVFQDNLISAPDDLELRIDLERRPQPGEKLSWEQWQATGQDTGSRRADPLFVDPANHDYRLQPESPALAMGFEPIPFDRIGLYEDPLRATWPVAVDGGPEPAPMASAWQLPGFEPREAKPLVARDGLGNLSAKLKAGGPVRIAYFGGGIHPTNGWRRQMQDWFTQTWPAAQLEFIDGSVTDAVRGSGFSVYRLGHDVLDHDPDLVMIDFTSDDHQTPSLEIQRANEGAVRQIRGRDPELDIVLLHAFRSGFEQAYREGVTPDTVTAYEAIADRYGIPSINLGLAAANLFDAGGWPGGHNPNEAANQAYAEAAMAGFGELLTDAPPPAPHGLPQPVRADNYESARLLPLTRPMLQGEWRELPADDPQRRAQARHFDTIWFTDQPGAAVEFTFTGTTASLYHLIGPDTGQVKVTVDGKDPQIRRQVDKWCTYHRLAAMPLASGLTPGEHTIRIELLPEPPDRSEPIAEAKRLDRYDPAAFEGVTLQIGWLRVMGGAE